MAMALPPGVSAPLSRPCVPTPRSLSLLPLSAARFIGNFNSSTLASAQHSQEHPWRRKRSGATCIAQAAESSLITGVPEHAGGPAERSSVDELNTRFGSDQVSFDIAAGVRTAELRISDGSSCRVLVDGARISSYQASLWHGGQEEILYSTSNEEEEEEEEEEGAEGTSDGPSGWNLLEGGIALSFPAFGGLQVGQAGVRLGECGAKASWDVVHTESLRNRTSLKLACEGLHELDGETHSWKLEYEITLSATGLKAQLRATNTGFTSFNIAPSIVAHILVADVEGCFLIGCKGHKYIPGSSDSKAGQRTIGMQVGGWLQGLVGGGAKDGASKDDGAIQEATPSNKEVGLTGDNSTREGSALLWQPLMMNKDASKPVDVETRDYSDVVDGTCRLFPSGPDQVTLVDRGKRRSFAFEKEGLADLMVANPGSKCGLEDWPHVIALSFGNGAEAVCISPRMSWAGSVLIRNIGAPE